jgi:hypothetical protein
MKPCTQFEAVIAAHAAADEALPAPLAAHLRDCTACTKFYAAEQGLLMSIAAGVSATVAGEPSPEFFAALRAQLSGAAERQLLAAIDGGVAATVAAQPSPAFAAAVRARIAETGAAPAAGWWPARAWLLPLGTAAAMAFAAYIALRPPVPAPVTHGTPQPPVTAAQPVVVPPAGSSRTEAQPHPPPRIMLVAKSVPATGGGDPCDGFECAPTVMVAPSEWLAIARLYQAVRNGTFNAAALPVERPLAGTATVAPLVTQELKTAPVEVKELSPPVATAGTIK